MTSYAFSIVIAFHIPLTVTEIFWNTDFFSSLFNSIDGEMLAINNFISLFCFSNCLGKTVVLLESLKELPELSQEKQLLSLLINP